MSKKQRTNMILAAIAAILMLLASSCSSHANVPGDYQITETQIPSSKETEAIRQDKWLESPGFEQLLPDIRSKARKLGFEAAWIKPDPQQENDFLVVAIDEAAARQINGFFYWYRSQDNGDPGEPHLILCIDRLFHERLGPDDRTDGRFTDSAIISLLDHSLRDILRKAYHPEIVNFILDCYRQRFGELYRDPAIPGWTKQKIWNGIEVIFHAEIFYTVTFRLV